MAEWGLADAVFLDRKQLMTGPPASVERLWKKCQATGGGEQFSNADNMALVGVLSTGLLHEQLVRRAPLAATRDSFRTVVDRVPGQATGRSPADGAEARGTS